mmetsp:Transcript_5161/g.9722  ORF Transcript_5161/g.9722 Transcript_5161/m.9722 type:complete len:227 (-) Transcript_5161:17-697(-)
MAASPKWVTHARLRTCFSRSKKRPKGDAKRPTLSLRGVMAPSLAPEPNNSKSLPTLLLLVQGRRGQQAKSAPSTKQPNSAAPLSAPPPPPPHQVADGPNPQRAARRANKGAEAATNAWNKPRGWWDGVDDCDDHADAPCCCCCDGARTREPSAPIAKPPPRPPLPPPWSLGRNRAPAAAAAPPSSSSLERTPLDKDKAGGARSWAEGDCSAGKGRSRCCPTHAISP